MLARSAQALLIFTTTLMLACGAEPTEAQDTAPPAPIVEEEPDGVQACLDAHWQPVDPPAGERTFHGIVTHASQPEILLADAIIGYRDWNTTSNAEGSYQLDVTEPIPYFTVTPPPGSQYHPVVMHVIDHIGSLEIWPGLVTHAEFNELLGIAANTSDVARRIDPTLSYVALMHDYSNATESGQDSIATVTVNGEAPKDLYVMRYNAGLDTCIPFRETSNTYAADRECLGLTFLPELEPGSRLEFSIENPDRFCHATVETRDANPLQHRFESGVCLVPGINTLGTSCGYFPPDELGLEIQPAPTRPAPALAPL